MKARICFDTNQMNAWERARWEYFIREGATPLTAFLCLMLHKLRDGGSGLDAMGFCGAREDGPEPDALPRDPAA